MTVHRSTYRPSRWAIVRGVCWTIIVVGALSLAFMVGRIS